MNITPKSKKIMNKDEIALLVDLIQSNPILTSKETNATTNKNKEDTWFALAATFNAKSGSIPRTKEQLKLKWDNLKKAALKRTQEIRMNHLKTGGGKADLIPGDETLEKVSSLLGSTCTGFMVPFGGDGVGCNSLMVLDVDDERDVGEGLCSFEGVSDNKIPDNAEIIVETPSKGTQDRKQNIHGITEMNLHTAEGSKIFFGMPLSKQLKAKKEKKKQDNDGRLARNLAIAKYYDKKKEKLDIEIKILKLELAQKENVNNDK